jgi:DNA-binding NarL/FixJ family response regulator
VLIWISKGFLEDLARIATKRENSFDLVGIVTDAGEAQEHLTTGNVDIVLLGKGRLDEWAQMWNNDVFIHTPRFCVMLVATIPVSTSTLLEASQVGIHDVVDLTMNRDDIGQRMLDLYAQLRRDAPMQNGMLESYANRHHLLREISDETDRKILWLISQGKFDKEISEELFLSLQTIRNRVSRMLTETGARNRTHLAVMFTRERALEDDEIDTDSYPDEEGPRNQVA